MDKASDLLNTFKKKFSSHKKNQLTLSEAVFDCLNVEIEPKNFLIKEDTVYIKCSSVIKNEILFNKEKIISLFYKKEGTIKNLKIK